MTDRTQRAAARSQSFQLLALGFCHPVPEFHARLADGTYGGALTTASRLLLGEVRALPANYPDFVTFEAQYIELFAIGNPGRPAVGLHAGEYAALRGGKPRPQVMLEYTSWYRHFGVSTTGRDEERELPDHISCQLEFLALLANLDADAEPGSAHRAGYRRAQRDFMARHVRPCVGQIVPRLHDLAAERPGAALFAALGDTTLALIERSIDDFAMTDDTGMRAATH